MNAEIGIDEEGKAYIALSAVTQTEVNTMRFMSAFLPLRIAKDDDFSARVTGDRLPGSGKGG